jgi:hypothetical protein
LVIADTLAAGQSGAKLLAVNTAYRFIPYQIDAILGADQKWWSWHPEAVSWPNTMKFCLQPTPYPEVTTIPWTTGIGLDLTPGQVRGGGHGGYAAINLAVHLGAKRIVLLGYDLAPARNGVDHCHAPHPDGSHLHYEHRRAIYKTLMEPLTRLGITILNASRRTAIPDIPRVTLEEALGVCV